MKKWKNKVNLPKLGICEVVEMEDDECNLFSSDEKHYAPISQGFVNLFKNDKSIGWCGILYAKKYVI